MTDALYNNKIFLQNKSSKSGSKEYDFSIIENDLKKFEQLSKTDQDDITTLMFGWKINEDGIYEENMFEKILMESKNEDSIALVWKTFKLWQKSFILDLVRKLKRFLQNYNLINNFLNQIEKSRWKAPDRLR